MAEFLSRLEREGRISPRIVEELSRLAEQDALSDQDAIEAALKEEPPKHDEAQDA
jgi:hypothetical protein